MNKPVMRKTTRDEKIVRPGVYEVPVEQAEQEPIRSIMLDWKRNVLTSDEAMTELFRHYSSNPAYGFSSELDNAEQKTVFSSECPKCRHKVISTHTGAVWWCPKCQHEWPFNKQSYKQSVSQEVKELRQQVAALKAVVDAWNNVEQEPVAWMDLHKELGQLRWAGKDIGWDLAIDAVRNRLEELSAAHVRTKDLTDEEVEALFWKWKSATEYPVPLFEFRDIARAVIAADREKNRA